MEREEVKFATINFSNRREEYEVGDTITLTLDNGDTAKYVLTEITPHT